tara:strand:- start:9824 stop:10222 length:399 start_codon:yes stop_codon:yes gene_type:complete
MDKRKAGFKNRAQTTHMGGKTFRLDQDLVFYSARYHQEFTAPAGMLTDFASIPQFLQGLVSVLGNNIRSAILHDFHTTPKGKKANKVTQKEADMLFSEGLSVDQVRWSKARVMYGGVTIFQRVKYMFKREKY